MSVQPGFPACSVNELSPTGMMKPERRGPQMPSPMISSSARSSRNLDCCRRSRARSLFLRRFFPDVDMRPPFLRPLRSRYGDGEQYESVRRNVRPGRPANHRSLLDSAEVRFSRIRCGDRPASPHLEIRGVRFMREIVGGLIGLALLSPSLAAAAEPAPSPQCKSAGVTISFASGSTEIDTNGRGALAGV